MSRVRSEVCWSDGSSVAVTFDGTLDRMALEQRERIIWTINQAIDDLTADGLTDDALRGYLRRAEYEFFVGLLADQNADPVPSVELVPSV